MELTQLKYFQAAAEECNFTRAAKRLNISQPALSKAILNLEDELQVALFVRDGNRIALSPYGSAFLEDVNGAIMHLESGVRNMRMMSGRDNGRISVAISEAVNISEPSEHFLVENPNVYYREVPCSAAQMEEKLLDTTVDFGVTYDPIDNPKLVWRPIYQDRMSVLLPKDHPLASRSVVSLADLAGERILQGDNFGRLSFVRNFYDHEVYSPQIVYEGSDKSMVGRLVSKGVGLAFAPLSVSLSLHQKETFPVADGAVDLAFLPLQDNFWHKSIGIMSLRDYRGSQASEALLQSLIAFYQALPPAF